MTSEEKARHARSTSFGRDELLILAKAFMKVSCNAKQSTDRKVDKFWEDISLHFQEFVSSTNKLNESNPEYIPINTNRGIHSLRNCWQLRLQPAIQKFAGIV
jgi:hypothetical protein